MNRKVDLGTPNMEGLWNPFFIPSFKATFSFMSDNPVRQSLSSNLIKQWKQNFHQLIGNMRFFQMYSFKEYFTGHLKYFLFYFLFERTFLRVQTSYQRSTMEEYRIKTKKAEQNNLA